MPWGYASLLLVAVIVLAAAVGTGFLAGLMHPRAGGIRTVLFAVLLVVTVVLLREYGPVPIPHIGGNPVTAELAETKLGAFGVGALLLAGAIGILAPVEVDGNVG